ncbi:MAG: hypothetical protein QQN63_02575 [Nitrosopumilus sp.]
MSTESYLWTKIDKAMETWEGDYHFTRHEDKSRPGIPDVSYGMLGVNGWIELKARDKWPVDPEKLVRFRHELTRPQRRFQRKRGAAAGHVFVMLIVGRKNNAEYLLFPWQTEMHLEASTRAELYELACYYSVGKINVRDFVSSLTA